jgi:hypothetical protein
MPLPLPGAGAVGDAQVRQQHRLVGGGGDVEGAAGVATADGQQTGPRPSISSALLISSGPWVRVMVPDRPGKN